MKKIILYISILLSAAACEQLETGTVYFYHVSEVNASQADSIKIKDYVRTKNIITEQAFDEGSISANDQKAIELFKQYAARINVEDIKDLTPASSFTYAVSRWKNKDNPYSGTVYVDSVVCVKH